MNNCPNCGNDFQNPLGDCFIVFCLDKQYYCRQSCIVEFYKDKTDLLISEYEKLYKEKQCVEKQFSKQ